MERDSILSFDQIPIIPADDPNRVITLQRQKIEFAMQLQIRRKHLLEQRKRSLSVPTLEDDAGEIEAGFASGRAGTGGEGNEL